MAGCNTNCSSGCNNANMCSDSSCFTSCTTGCIGKCTKTCNNADMCSDSSCFTSCKTTCIGFCTGACKGDCGNNETKQTNTSSGSSGSGGSTSSNNTSSSTSTDTSTTAETVEPELDDDEDTVNEYKSQLSTYTDDSTKVNQDPSGSKISYLRGVSGMPYQFLPDTDRRIFDEDNTKNLNDYECMGRKYIERIAQRANILFLTPGKAKFLGNIKSTTKANILKNMITNIEEEGISKALTNDNESYRFYTFNFDIDNYFRYLNPMCRAAARYLKLQAYDIDGGRTASESGLVSGKDGLTHADYQPLLSNDGQTSFFSNAYGALTFYLDNVNAQDEGIQTSLSESNFSSSTLSGLSDRAQELNFLAGKVVNDVTSEGIWETFADPDAVREGQQEIESFVGAFLKNNKFIKDIGLGAIAIANGGQIIFPKIWRDTTYESESVSVTVKLTSPDADDLSIFWNILVPMYALICLAAPKGYVGVDAYSSPFVIRAFCQSMFNIECGFITSLSIRRGGEGYWTKSGLPTVMDVSITIQDVYDSRYISTSEKGSYISINPVKTAQKIFQKTPFLKNTAMLNWIACTCGVNVNKPDIIRDIQMYIEHAIENPVGDLFTNFIRQLGDRVKNWTPKLLQILGSVFKS